MAHVLCTPTERLPPYMLLSKESNNREMGRGGQSMTLRKGVKVLISGLVRAGPV